MLVLRPRGDVSAAAEPIRRRLQAAVPEVPFIRVRPLQELVSPEGRSWRLGATVFSAFGALALVVAALGLYSMLAFEVSQRMHELGVRRALGARLGDLLRLVVGQSVRITAIGGMIGLVVALASGPWIEPLLFRTSVREPSILGVAVGVLVVVGVAAALVPASRAARVNPVTALKAE